MKHRVYYMTLTMRFFALEKSLILHQEFIFIDLKDNDLDQIRKELRFKELVDKYTCFF